MRSLSIVAPDLVPGDLLVSSGIGGACGLVTRVSVLPAAVGVWLADGQVHSLGLHGDRGRSRGLSRAANRNAGRRGSER